MSVVVVGSANLDERFTVSSIPRPGETVLAAGRDTARGGKGQNQAIAAARSGADTRFVGRVGDDPEGERIRAGLQADGIDDGCLHVTEAPTGRAIIAVEPTGENAIIVDPGANAAFCELTAADRAAIEGAQVLVLQLEIPLDTVAAAARIARAAGTTVLLNAAPMLPSASQLLDDVDILVVNEVEAEALAGEIGPDLGVPTVVVTRGADGADYSTGTTMSRVPAPKVQAVDTTGAGDTFVGALAAGLAAAADLESAVRYAVHAAALSVQTAGAAPSIPRRSAVRETLPTTLT